MTEKYWFSKEQFPQEKEKYGHVCEAALLRESKSCHRWNTEHFAAVLGSRWLMISHKGHIHQVTQVKFTIKFSVFYLPGSPGFVQCYRQMVLTNFRYQMMTLWFLNTAPRSFSDRLHPIANHAGPPASRSCGLPNAGTKYCIIRPQSHFLLCPQVPPLESRAPSGTLMCGGNEQFYECCN